MEVGTGSGYQTAVLAELAGSVVSIERHEELSRRAWKRIGPSCGYQNVKLIVGDGTLGWPEDAPYDRILVAAAAREIPPALVEQLAEGGTLVIPVGDAGGQDLQAFHKVGGQLARPMAHRLPLRAAGRAGRRARLDETVQGESLLSRAQ